MKVPDFSVKDRVALLTGSARGIGLAIAQALAASGTKVAIQDIDLDVAQAEAAAINAAGGKAIALGGDGTDLTLAERWVDETVSQLGGLHILVNNLGIQMHADFLTFPVEEMQRQATCNLILPALLCQIAIPHMQAARWGRVLNIGSVQGNGGNLGMGVYAMTKAALENLTKGLARKFARDGVTANCIAPGWFDTLRNIKDFPNEAVAREKGRHIPLGRVGQPADCAGLAVLLCSPAGEYITGQTIYVDGGITTS